MATFYSPRIVTDGLVLHLDAANNRSFVSGSNTWFDLSRNNNSGSLVNGPTYNSSNGGSILFDGGDDYVQCAGSIVTSTATFLVWINRNGNQGQDDGIIYSRGTSVSGMAIQSSNQLAYNWNNVSLAYSWQSGLTIPNLQWCLCAISVAPTLATAYIFQQTGIISAVNNLNHSSTTMDDIKIGWDDFASRYFTGNIAVAQIYNRALSAAEIRQNYNATKGRFGLT